MYLVKTSQSDVKLMKSMIKEYGKKKLIKMITKR